MKIKPCQLEEFLISTYYSMENTITITPLDSTTYSLVANYNSKEYKITRNQLEFQRLYSSYLSYSRIIPPLPLFNHPLSCLYLQKFMHFVLNISSSSSDHLILFLSSPFEFIGIQVSTPFFNFYKDAADDEYFTSTRKYINDLDKLLINLTTSSMKYSSKLLEYSSILNTTANHIHGISFLKLSKQFNVLSKLFKLLEVQVLKTNEKILSSGFYLVYQSRYIYSINQLLLDRLNTASKYSTAKKNTLKKVNELEKLRYKTSISTERVDFYTSEMHLAKKQEVQLEEELVIGKEVFLKDVDLYVKERETQLELFLNEFVEIQRNECLSLIQGWENLREVV